MIQINYHYIHFKHDEYYNLVFLWESESTESPLCQIKDVQCFFKLVHSQLRRDRAVECAARLQKQTDNKRIDQIKVALPALVSRVKICIYIYIVSVSGN